MSKTGKKTKTKQAVPRVSRAKSKTRAVRATRRVGRALRGGDGPALDLIDSPASTAQRKRSRTAEARTARPLH